LGIIIKGLWFLGQNRWSKFPKWRSNHSLKAYNDFSFDSTFEFDWLQPHEPVPQAVGDFHFR